MATLKDLLVSGPARVVGNITGKSFIKDGGTSSQFLKADGSVDANAYSTTSHTHSTSIATSSGTNQITLAFGTKYAITAGGTSYVFTMPGNPNTNTTYTIATGDAKGQIKVTPSSGSAYNVDVNGLGSAAFEPTSSFATSSHTHSTSIATSSGTNQITLAFGTKYAITAGGNSYVFTMPSNPNTNTTYTIATGDSNGQIKVTPSSGDAYNVNVKGLGSAAYTASTAYAAASHSHSYLPLAGGEMTGSVQRKYPEASENPVIDVASANQDVWIWRVSDSDYSTDNYGFGIKYLGTGSGNNNDLVLYADNQTSSPKEAYRVHQDGSIVFTSTPKVGSTNVSLEGHTHNYAASNHNHSGVYKPVQTAVSDPSASATTSTTFIDSISQDTNGVITATKKTLPTYASTSHNHDSTYKKKQTAVTDPAVDTNTASAFIDTITQNEQGVITATKKSLPTASSSVAGIMKLGASGGAATYGHSHSFSEISSRGEAYLDWGGKNHSGAYGPIDAAMVGKLGANRTAFTPASAITVQYSRNGGSTWTDYGASNLQKIGFFTNFNSGGFVIGKSSTASGNQPNANCLLRVILKTDGVLYTVLNKFVIYCSTSGSSGTYCKIDARLQSNVASNTDTWTVFANNVGISGWSGYNVINTSGLTTYGNTAASQYGEVRFTFGCTGSSTSYPGLTVSGINCYGGVGWTVPSTMAGMDSLFTYDMGQNATFPAGITATSFVKSGGTSSQFLKANGSVDSTSYLPLTGGTVTGNITMDGANLKWANNTALPVNSSPQYILCIDAFASGGTTKYTNLSDLKTALGSMSPASHTHGNIQNGGTLQTNDITIANGDKLVVTDSSDSSKIARTSIAFDGSTTSQVLSKKGTWVSLPTNTDEKVLQKVDTTSNSLWRPILLGYNGVEDITMFSDVTNSVWSNTKIGFNVSTGYIKVSGGYVVEGQSGFLKADGGIDSNTYALSNHSHSGYAASGHTHNISLSATGTSTIDLAASTTYTLTAGGSSVVFKTPAAGSYTHPTTSGNKHIPSGGSSGKFLGWSADGTATWVANPNTDEQVKQVASTTNTWKSILVGENSYQASGTTPTDITGKSYVVKGVSVNPYTGMIAATGFIGTAGGFLKGDGTIDGNTYALSNHSHSGYASSSHNHGNIQNGGTLQTNDITIANGDKLVVTDSSDSSKIARTSITFDGSTTTQYLSKKGTWENAPSCKVIAGDSATQTQNRASGGSVFINTVYGGQVSNSLEFKGLGSMTIQSDDGGLVTFECSGGGGQGSGDTIVGKTVTLSTSAQAVITRNGSDSGSVKLDSAPPSTWLGTSNTKAAAGSHGHGNIANGGQVSTITTATSGDRILIADSSSHYDVTGGLQFGSDTTKFLCNDGTWKVPAGGGGGGSAAMAVDVATAQQSGGSGTLGTVLPIDHYNTVAWVAMNYEPTELDYIPCLTPEQGDKILYAMPVGMDDEGHLFIPVTEQFMAFLQEYGYQEGKGEEPKE